MWADALDRMLARLASAADVDVERIRAISGSAQQHGSVYLNRDAPADAGASLDPSLAAGAATRHRCSRDRNRRCGSTRSTARRCAAIEDALGGADAVAALTGSPACERFTGPQIRKFAREQPEAYARRPRAFTWSARFWRRCWPGVDAPIDPGDGSGMNLMDLQTSALVAGGARRDRAGAGGERLPPIRPSWEIFGTLSPYWQKRYALPAAAIVPWTGDNPSSLIGTGIIHDRVVAVSLGTSDTVFALHHRAWPGSRSHVFRSPTGDFMNLVCFRNGSLARECGAHRVRPRLGRGRARCSNNSRATTAG